jgi:predicted amidohydrolase
VKLALSQFSVEKPDNFAAFTGRIASLAAEAKAQAADLLVLPEYAGMVLAGASISTADIQAELDTVVSQSTALVAALRDIAMGEEIWMLGGTLPMRDADGKIRNRAALFAPSGQTAFQDKQSMTRFEAERWGISGGKAPVIFATPFGRIGISICYDSEFPLHVRAQVTAGAKLILVPSCTDSMAGFHRVRLSARARALENQCFVAMSPLVGNAPWSGAIDENHGYAGLYGPPDHGFPEDGVLVRGTLDEPNLVFAEIDMNRIETVRREGGVLNHRDWPDQIAPCPVHEIQ